MNIFTRTALVIVGIPREILFRALGVKWTLGHEFTYTSPDGYWSLTADKGMRYDSFTCAPNLRKPDGSKSDADALHDKGWVTGEKDDGSLLTFDENNGAFESVLVKEDHPNWVIKIYLKGVSASFMRRRWEQIHNHK